MSSYDPAYTRFGFPRPTAAIGRLMIVNAVVFVANIVLSGRLSVPDGEGGGCWFGLSWPKLLEGYGAGALRLVTYQFTHSWHSPWHLLWNIVFLYFFGGIAEQRGLGYRGTIRLYLVGGIVAGVAHMAMLELVTGRSTPVVGASGSCYALCLYAICVAPRREVFVLFFNFQLIFLGFLLIGLAIYEMYVDLVGGSQSVVADGAHLGGALFGILAWHLAWFRAPDSGPGAGPIAWARQRVRDWRVRRRSDIAAADQAEIDRILAKIQQQGLPSLSTGERRTLERASQRARRK